MKRMDSLTVCGAVLGLTSAMACGGSGDGRSDDDGSSSGGGGVTVTAGATEGGDGDSGEAGDDGPPKLDVGSGGGSECGNGDIGCTDKIDLLFVIDNSGTMAEEQENLARNFPLLIERLENLQDSQGMPVNADVQIMVTTTDFGNPKCTMFEPQDYDPAKGAPITTACSERLQRFTGLEGDVMVPEACTNVCLNSEAVPQDTPFISFNANGDNIPDTVMPADINGDGMEDSAVAQALACIGPQGIDGCGFESPLENMLQALNPGAAWNQGGTPFLREGALLAIAIVTDEADCSVQDYTIMDDDAYREVNPANGQKDRATSAVCWNAGVTCDGPDANGVYSGCSSTANDKLQPIERYTSYLIDELREKQKKEVIMLGILGVPQVTDRNDEPPFEPIAGGVFDLVYRNWRDGVYPTDGDILPAEFNAGVTAAEKEFDFGIGPGCTGQDPDSGAFTGQAIPPVRVKEVCESLNIEKDDGTTDVRCCIESICDTDFSAAIDCLTGIIQESITAPG